MRKKDLLLRVKKIGKMANSSKKRVKELRKWAKENLLDKEVVDKIKNR